MPSFSCWQELHEDGKWKGRNWFAEKEETKRTQVVPLNQTASDDSKTQEGAGTASQGDEKQKPKSPAGSAENSAVEAFTEDAHSEDAGALRPQAWC